MAPAILIIGLVVVGAQIFDGVPRETEIHYQLGPRHSDISEVTVTYILDSEEVAGSAWRVGGVRAVSHTVDLTPGRYRVRAEIQDRDGDVHVVTRALTVPADGMVRIDLFDRVELAS